MKKMMIVMLAVILLSNVVSGCDGTPTPTESPLPTPIPSPLAIPGGGDGQALPIGGETMNFQDAIVNGIPLLIIIAGLVEFAKKFGLQGEACTVLSMVLGLALGVLYQLQSGVPADLAGIFGMAIYGLGMGLTACGLYDVVFKR